MISPTPGRIVWYFPAIADGRDPNGQPLGAMVAKVLSERSVNLTVSHGDGSTYAAQSVQLLQDDDAVPETAYACWMPYQIGQAKKTEPAVAATANEADKPKATGPAIDMTSVTGALDQLAMTSKGNIDQLAAQTQTKFEQFGNWLQTHVGDLMKRVAVIEGKPPEATLLPHPNGDNANSV